LSAHFLDANIFLEINIDKYDYGKECDEIFNRDYNRHTSNKVMIEVNRMKDIVIESFNKLYRHYLKGKSRFASDKEISSSMMEKIREIEKWLKGYSGRSKRLLLNKLKQLFIETVEYRKNNILNPLIQDSGNTRLFKKISEIVTDHDDAWHITDAYTWCCNKCNLIFWSIDHHIVKPKEEILKCICEFGGVDRGSLPFDVLHIKDIYEI